MMNKYLLLPLVLLFAACGTVPVIDAPATVPVAVQSTVQPPTPQPTRVIVDACRSSVLTAYSDAIDEELQTFQMQISVAGATPRMSIGIPLQRLLDMQTETRKMDVPECLKSYHGRIVNAMGLYRYGYENFAAQGKEDVTTMALKRGELELAAAQADMALIRSGKIPPMATPWPTPQK